MSTATNIPATRLVHPGERNEQLKAVPGAFSIDFIYGRECGLRYSCPCGCGAIHFRHMKPSDLKGEPDKPTVDGEFVMKSHPDVKDQTVSPDGLYHWRGRLTDGVWVSV